MIPGLANISRKTVVIFFIAVIRLSSSDRNQVDGTILTGYPPVTLAARISRAPSTDDDSFSRFESASTNSQMMPAVKLIVAAKSRACDQPIRVAIRAVTTGASPPAILAQVFISPDSDPE